MTLPEKTTAIALLDLNIPENPDTHDGKFTQIVSYSPDGVHQVALDVYNGPQGAGYIRRVERDKNGILWRYSDHSGPESWRRSGWESFN